MTWLADIRAAISEMFAPRLHVLSDEDQQTVDEQVRVRSAYIQSQRHPKQCDTECYCDPDGAA